MLSSGYRLFPNNQTMRHYECSHVLRTLGGKGMRLEDLVIPRQPSPSTETAPLTFCLGKKLLLFHERWFTG